MIFFECHPVYHPMREKKKNVLTNISKERLCITKPKTSVCISLMKLK